LFVGILHANISSKKVISTEAVEVSWLKFYQEKNCIMFSVIIFHVSLNQKETLDKKLAKNQANRK
jgi:hypothetical protein